VKPVNMMFTADGDLFYPDSQQEAQAFATGHGARPTWPREFPFELDLDDDEEDETPVRARVAVVVDVRSREPIEVSQARLWDWVADWIGSRVCDQGPYSMLVSGYDAEPEVRQEVGLGGVFEPDAQVPVVWIDGTTPRYGFHCAECREPKVPDAGPCLREVPWGVDGSRPCMSDDAQHHGRCWHFERLDRVSRPVPPTGDVA
jgi:hypothetical protein